MTSRKPWLIAAATAVILYSAMWAGYVLNWHWLNAVDTRSLQTLHDIGATRPGWVSFWVVFCIVFGPTGFRVMALALIVLALVRRNMRAALFLVVSVELMGVVTEVAKRLAGRPRPSSALVYGASTSFPSGHALGVMVGVLALLTVMWPCVAQRWRTSLAAAGAALVLLVGFARVALNVHHPSDVLAGWALGLLYYLLCLRVVPPRPFTSAAETPAERDGAP